MNNVYQQGDVSVQIVVYDPIIDGHRTQSQTLQTSKIQRKKRAVTTTTTAKPTTTTTAKPKPATSTKLIGGHGNHRFNITCKTIPTEGVNETVIHVFKGKYALYLQFYFITDSHIVRKQNICLNVI